MTGTEPVAASDARTRSPNAPPVCASSASSSRTAASSARRCSAHAASSSPDGRDGPGRRHLGREVRDLLGERLRERAQALEARRLPLRVAAHGGQALQPRVALSLPRLRDRALAVAQLREHRPVLALQRARLPQRLRGQHEHALHEDVAGSDGSAHGRRIIPPSRRGATATQARRAPGRHPRVRRNDGMVRYATAGRRRARARGQRSGRNARSNTWSATRRPCAMPSVLSNAQWMPR